MNEISRAEFDALAAKIDEILDFVIALRSMGLEASRSGGVAAMMMRNLMPTTGGGRS